MLNIVINNTVPAAKQKTYTELSNSGSKIKGGEHCEKYKNRYVHHSKNIY